MQGLLSDKPHSFFAIEMLEDAQRENEIKSAVIARKVSSRGLLDLRRRSKVLDHFFRQVHDVGILIYTGHLVAVVSEHRGEDPRTAADIQNFGARPERLRNRQENGK